MEELMASGNGRCNTIRSFTAKQLRSATRNFQSPRYTVDGKWFKTALDCRSVLIKIHEDHITAEKACRDIAISSQMSNHGRVLKLLGCCLELPVPALVYEDAENGPLGSDGNILSPSTPSLKQTLPWKMRLRVAKDIAHALTYLHAAFSRPIVHRDVKATRVFLDKDLVPKLSDFSFSISIPEGEKRVESELVGTCGFVDPDYYTTSFVTEKTDVYSFGVFLLVLMTGKPAVFNNMAQPEPEFVSLTDLVRRKSWDEVVDSKLLEEGRAMNEEEEVQFYLELQAFLNLAVNCVQVKVEDRPLMVDVAKELDKRHRTSVVAHP